MQGEINKCWVRYVLLVKVASVSLRMTFFPYLHGNGNPLSGIHNTKLCLKVQAQYEFNLPF